MLCDTYISNNICVYISKEGTINMILKYKVSSKIEVYFLLIYQHLMDGYDSVLLFPTVIQSHRLGLQGYSRYWFQTES